MNLLSTKYNQLTEPNVAKIDYSDPSTRFAYIYRYVTCHANLVYRLISTSNRLTKLFKAEQVTISCVGGGPGSDLLGAIKYYADHDSLSKLKCYLLDGNKAWNESWSDVDKKVDSKLCLSVNFMPLDVTERNTWLPYKKYLQADLFTLVYFISELYRFRNQCTDYFNYLFSEAKSNSYMLFIDNNSANFYNWFDSLTQNYDWEVLEKDECNIQLDTDKEKTDLGEYFKKFGCPKLEANVAYRIIRKNG
ncbi:MAG: hypothetical protein JW841_07215 [Deltaproteobacteria bacterium]|nr:hypothetical protein [Deltaproteobacteria bacterium]